MVADTLSRGFDKSGMKQSPELDFVHVNLIKNKTCPSADKIWTVIARATALDETVQKVIKTISTWCPGQHILSPYYQYKGEFSVLDGILFRGTRMVSLKVLQKSMLKEYMKIT